MKVDLFTGLWAVGVGGEVLVLLMRVYSMFETFAISHARDTLGK